MTMAVIFRNNNTNVLLGHLGSLTVSFLIIFY